MAAEADEDTQNHEWAPGVPAGRDQMWDVHIPLAQVSQGTKPAINNVAGKKSSFPWEGVNDYQ